MKNIFRVLFFTVVLIVILVGCSRQAIELGSSFINRVYDSIYETGAVDFAEITDFEWEQLVFMGPYSPVNTVLEEIGVNWARPVTHVQHSDVNVLFLFVNEKDVVAFVHFPRYRVDFFQIIQRSSFGRSEAVFIVEDDE